MSIKTPLAIALITVTTTFGAAPASVDANWFKKAWKAVYAPVKVIAVREVPRGWVVTPTGRVTPLWGIIGICGCAIDDETITRCRALLAQPGYRRVSHLEAIGMLGEMVGDARSLPDGSVGFAVDDAVDDAR